MRVVRRNGRAGAARTPAYELGTLSHALRSSEVLDDSSVSLESGNSLSKSLPPRDDVFGNHMTQRNSDRASAGAKLL